MFYLFFWRIFSQLWWHIDTFLKLEKIRKNHDGVTFLKLGNAHEVQNQWENRFDTILPTVSTILSVNWKFDETGPLKDVSCSGQPVSVLPEKKLEEPIIQNLQLSIRQDAAETSASKTTGQAAMKLLNFKPHRSTLIVDLNDEDFDWPSQFYEIWLEKLENDPSFIDEIFWIDEAQFNRNVTVTQHNRIY